MGSIVRKVQISVFFGLSALALRLAEVGLGLRV